MSWISKSGLMLILAEIGLFLSAWIVIPAPIFALLPLGVGVPELSPWLLVGNLVVSLWALFGRGDSPKEKLRQRSLRRAALGCSLVGMMLSSLPLMQLPGTAQRFETAVEQVLGQDYRTKIPVAVQTEWRSQPFRLTDVFTGIPTPHQKVRHTAGIVFARPDNVSLTLDIHRPAIAGKHPTIVTVYGGGWQNGDPSRNVELNRYLAGQGYTVVAIDYRHAPRYRFPVQLLDVQTALTFVRQHAAEYDIDPERIALLGRSAGAHLAMLAAWQSDALPFRAVVNYYGPVDLAAGYRNPPLPDPIDSRATLEKLLGGTPDQRPKLYQQASPIAFVRPKLPPVLLVYGGRDHIVEAKYGRALSDRLRSAGNTALFLEIPWAEHAFDEVFHGVSNQLALYYTERFLAWTLYR